MDKDKDNIRAIRPDICIEREENSPPEDDLPEPNEELVATLKTMLSLAEEGVLQELNGVMGYYDDVVTPVSIGFAVDENRMIGCLYKLVNTMAQPTIVFMEEGDEFFD